MQESVDVFKRVIDQNIEEKNRNCLQAGERKVPKPLSNALLENISSNFVFPRPKRDAYAKKSQFPKTQYQEKILYKKPPFTLRNQLKHHVITQQVVQQGPTALYQPNAPLLANNTRVEVVRASSANQQPTLTSPANYNTAQAYRVQPVATSGSVTPHQPYVLPVPQNSTAYQPQGQPGQYTPQTTPRPAQPTPAPLQVVQSSPKLT